MHAFVDQAGPTSLLDYVTACDAGLQFNNHHILVFGPSLWALLMPELLQLQFEMLGSMLSCPAQTAKHLCDILEHIACGI